MRVWASIVVGMLLFGPVVVRADRADAPIEAFVRVPGLDARRFVGELARRTGLSLVLIDEAASPPSRARLELGYDAARGAARVAYHDGRSDAPALVVIARFSPGTAPSEGWLLSQAETAIRSFQTCEESLGGFPEVLDPWSPAHLGRRQRWAEVLDPWLGCGETDAVPDWPADASDYILEGEVLDPWLEAAYEERAVALSAPRPGVAPREMKPHRSE